MVDPSNHRTCRKRCVCSRWIQHTNIPQFTGVEFSKDNAGQLLLNENIVSAKHTLTNLYSVERMRQTFPGKALINGFIASLIRGAFGSIGCRAYPYTPSSEGPHWNAPKTAPDTA